MLEKSLSFPLLVWNSFFMRPSRWIKISSKLNESEPRGHFYYINYLNWNDPLFLNSGVPDFVDKLHMAAQLLHEAGNRGGNEQGESESDRLPMWGWYKMTYSKSLHYSNCSDMNFMKRSVKQHSMIKEWKCHTSSSRPPVILYFETISVMPIAHIAQILIR